MGLQVYFNFKGNSREAIQFYSEVFDVDNANILTFGEAAAMSGEDYPDHLKNLVMNSQLNIFGSCIMISDVLPDMEVTVGDNISLVINHDSKEELEDIFDKLKVDGTVLLELQETFFSKYYGEVKDKFGITWLLML